MKCCHVDFHPAADMDLGCRKAIGRQYFSVQGAHDLRGPGGVERLPGIQVSQGWMKMVPKRHGPLLCPEQAIKQAAFSPPCQTRPSAGNPAPGSDTSTSCDSAP